MTVATLLKYLMAYWVIGCLMVGMAFGEIMNECGKLDATAPEAVALVATWPVTIGYAITRHTIGEDSVCEGGK